MNQSSDSQPLSPLKRALLAMDAMQAKIDALEQQRNEPIAVIGMACRFPGGADSPGAYWRNLKTSVHSVSEIPGSRWAIDEYYDPDPEAPGKMNTRHGGFIDRVEDFDAAFFSISPREAITMDPQQRILLETAFQAMQDAGLVRERLSGQQVGVFIGVTSNDHSQINLETGDVSNIDTYHITGNTNNAAAGRIAYVMGLRGPCMAIDTACSSSLTAMHQAVRSLQNQECSAAITGGVNLMLSPVTNLALSKTKVLSPSGCCRAFDDGADGMVRGEGCGVVILKRLSNAQKDGDRILAVVRGSAVNQDGPSSGLTVPNGPAHEALMRSALKRAGLQAEDIDYIETHGTGTSLGDPIELKALANVYATARLAQRPLLIGSVKTNIGHLEAGAGIAGFIKLVLSLQQEELPPHLHFQTPTQRFDWKRFPIQVVDKATAWKRGEHPRRCAVSSFGFSGVNAHVIVEEAPLAQPNASTPERPVHLLTCSAHTENALRESVGNLLDYAKTIDENQWADVCYSANVGRGHFSRRLAVCAPTLQEGRAQLQAWLNGEPNQVATHCAERAPKIAFLFTGQGAQYARMAQRLYDGAPTFRETMDACDAQLRDRLRQPLLEVLYGAQSESGLINQTEYTQPALFAVEFSLAKLWQSWGVTPSFVAGHSVGEYAAACLAGIFSFEDAARLIAERARLIQSVQAPGGMLALSCDEAAALELLKPYSDVSIAALNSPSQTVVSGGRDSINQLRIVMEEKNIRCVSLQVSHAFHSPLMDEILPAFESFAKTISYQTPQTAMVSNLTGALAESQIASARYWSEHIRKPVRFMDGMRALDEKGVDAYIEIGPNPVLTNLGQSCISAEGKAWLASLRKDGGDWENMLGALGGLYVNGARIDWRGFDRGYARARISLPTYPFQRQRYWVRDEASHRAPRRRDARRRASRSFLGERLALAGGEEVRFESRITLESFPFLADHRIHSQIVLPLSAYIDAAASAWKRMTNSATARIRDLSMTAPCVLHENVEAVLQTVLAPLDGGRYSFSIYCLLDENANEWRQHAVGELGPCEPMAPSLKPWAPSEEFTAKAHAHYQACRSRGVNFGPAFQTVQALRKTDAVAQSLLTETDRSDAVECFIDPIALDGCFQTLGAFVLAENADRLFLPVGIERLDLQACADRSGFTQATLVETSPDADSILFDFEMISTAGEAVASIWGMRLKEAPRDFLANQGAVELNRLFYQTEWRPLSLPTDQPAAPPGAALLVYADNDFAAAIKASLPASNVETASLQTAAKTELDLSRFGCIIFHFGAKEQSPANIAQEDTVLLVQSIQRLLQINASTPVFILTQNAQSVLPDDSLAGFASAPLWGVMKCLAQERPVLPCAMIDADDWSLAANQQALAQFASSPLKENQIALRNGVAYAARLARCQINQEGEIIILPDASYLITGGLRGVGFTAAQWLVDRGAKHVLLASRSGKLDAASEALVNEWKQRGAQVHCARCDVADAAQVNALAQQPPLGFPPLGGVIHSAGVLDDASIVNLNEQRIRNVFAPKVDGSMNLHHATKEMNLDFFVLFSSLSAVWGAQGQANYVAANSFLDGFAHWRRAQGLPALSVNWGPWRETGMAANESLLAQFESQGVRASSNHDGMASLARLMRSGATQCAVADIRWPRLLQQIGAAGTPPLLSELAQQEQPQISQPSPSNLLETLLALPEEKRNQPFGDYVTQQVVSVLRIPEAQFDAHAPLSRLGVDSLMAVELRNRFQRELKIDAPIPIFLDGSDTQTLIERLLQRFEKSAKTQPAQVKAKPSALDLAKDLDSSNAEKLLEKIDDLSDEEIDALFGSAVKEMDGDAEN